MNLTVDLAPDVLKRLEEKATRQGQNTSVYAAGLLADALTDDAAESPSLEAAIAAMAGRTPEQIAEARARVLSAARSARPLPAGKTLEEMVVGQWPGDETDPVVEAALDDLS